MSARTDVENDFTLPTTTERCGSLGHESFRFKNNRRRKGLRNRVDYERWDEMGTRDGLKAVPYRRPLQTWCPASAGPSQKFTSNARRIIRPCRKFCGCPSDEPNVCTSWRTTLPFVTLNNANCPWNSFFPNRNVRLALISS